MDKKLISIIIPVFNEELGILQFLDDLRATLSEQSDLAWEVIVVDDGSTDQTLSLLESNSPLDIKLVRLIRNFGHQAALEAGLRNATGSHIVTMDSDFQHPVSKVRMMVDEAISGNFDVVQGVRETLDSESLLRRWMSKFAYRLIRLLNPETILHAGDFRVISRRVLDLLLSMPESDKAFRFLIRDLGFRTKLFPFRSDKRRFGKSRYRRSESIHIFQIGLLNYSLRPVLIIFWVGFSTLFISIGYVLFIVYNFINEANFVPGWTSVVLLILLFSSFQMISIAILGYYVNCILRIVRRKPKYVILDTTDVRKR